MNGNDRRPGRGNRPGNDRRPEPPRPPRPEPPRPPRPPRPEPPRPPRPEPIENVIVARNARITDIEILPTGSFVTISFETVDAFNRIYNQVVRLVITRNTQILNQFRQPISVWGLRVGMLVNASFSSVMTRSYPPQANAFQIRIVSFF